MKMIDMLPIQPQQTTWLQQACWRQAAHHYELAGEWPLAANCWLAAGDLERAISLYQSLSQPAQAAPLLLQAGRYQEAAITYQTWLAQHRAGDVVSQVTALLGLAICLTKLAEIKTSYQQQTNFIYEANGYYHQARTIIEAEVARDLFLRGQCWAALGAYGVKLARPDLIRLGYEQALSAYGPQNNQARLQTLAAYRAAIIADESLLADLAGRETDWLIAEDGEYWPVLREQMETLGFVDKIHDIFHWATPAEQRALWQKLARITTDRHQVALNTYLQQLAPAGMVYIPAGSFVMGITPAEVENLVQQFGVEHRATFEQETPQHVVNLPGFYLGQNLVSNQDYRQFMRAGGYTNRAWWTQAGWQRKQAEGWRQPRYWRDRSLNAPRQPLVGISWYEAVAYANWAGARLPSEAEWEKAAAWNPQTNRANRYPWGDSWLDSRFSYNPLQWPEVGYSMSAQYSPYGLADMAGPYIWCSTRSNRFPYPYQPDDGREDLTPGDDTPRILRGGGSDPQWTRCTFRLVFHHPMHANNNWGLRLAAP